MEKQPPRILKPETDVEVPEVMERAVALMPAPKVEVAFPRIVEVADPLETEKIEVEALVKEARPVNQEEPDTERSEVEAFVRVVLPVTFSVEPRPTAPVTVKAPTLVEEEFVMKPPPSVRRLEKRSVPEKVLELPSNVEEAAVMVRFPPAEKRLPLMVPKEEVATIVPLPLTARRVLVRPLIQVVPRVVRVDEALLKALRPVQVLLFPRRLEEAAVMV